MLLPEPVVVRRSDGALAVASSRTIPDFSAQRATGDGTCHREAHPASNDADVARCAAVKAEGADHAGEEMPALIYAIGELSSQSDLVSRLSEFVICRGWRVVGVHSDTDESVHPANRRGLAVALAQLRRGVATVLVLDECTYQSTPDGLWLRIAVQCVGGVLCVVADDHMSGGEVATPGVQAGSAFAQNVRPLGSHREDLG